MPVSHHISGRAELIACHAYPNTGEKDEAAFPPRLDSLKPSFSCGATLDHVNYVDYHSHGETKRRGGCVILDQFEA